MKTKHNTTINLLTILLALGTGACSVKSSVNGKLPSPIPADISYRYSCESDQGRVGVRDLGGIFSVYQNDEVLFRSHQGQDLSIFLTTQEPSPENPSFVGFAMESQNTNDLEYYSLTLTLDTEAGQLKVQEEKYIRATPNDFWELASTQQVLQASSCVSQ